MTSFKHILLGSAAAFAMTGAAQAADLPVKKAVPIEYVRVCTAYGAGFFYIPGTDTCLRISGRARFEGAYQTASSRQPGASGDTSGYRGQLRFNLDARTRTAYGTLRAFARLDAASRTGVIHSGTMLRIGQAYGATGVDEAGRVQQYVNVDKAFIQFAGLTASRASSFYDFYAHDFEFYGATSGSDNSSTNLLAYTATFGDGLSATLSVEDPIYTRSPVFAPLSGPSVSPVFVAYADGLPTRYGNIDHGCLTSSLPCESIRPGAPRSSPPRRTRSMSATCRPRRRPARAACSPASRTPDRSRAGASRAV